MIDHDAAPGSLTHCQICGSEDLRLIIDLGHQPPCDSLLTSEQLNKPELTYPLRLNQCASCSLAQLDYVVPAKEVYPASYPYRAGISWPVVAAHKAMAVELVERFGKGLCVDIGCNDGTLLAQFYGLGCSVRGIEPTDVATYAPFVARVVNKFFTEQVAHEIVYEDGKAHIVTMTNVFAHMGDLGEVMRGVCKMLAKDGVLVIENHYLLDILDRNQFDSIYHEHVRTYSLKALVNLFDQYGMEVFDVDRVPRYGGNIRAYVCWRGSRAPARSVGSLLDTELALGLDTDNAWSKFRARVLDRRDSFLDFMCRQGPVPGCSAPGRASTLLNFYGVDSAMMPWTGELEGSLKIGKYVPGCHVPIVSNQQIIKEQPEYLIMLAWHYGEQIETRLRKEGVRSKLVMPLPNFSEGMVYV